MKHKMILFFLMMMLLVTCAGCGSRSKPEAFQPEQSQPEQSQPEQQPEQQQPETQNGETDKNSSEDVNPANGEELFTISKAQGSVTDFFDGGCKITPTQYDGDVAYEAAPGYENEDDCITISYNGDCVFQIAYVNIQTGTATYETANAEDIKKQTSLIICGDYDNDNVLHATRIFIYRSVR